MFEQLYQAFSTSFAPWPMAALLLALPLLIVILARRQHNRRHPTPPKPADKDPAGPNWHSLDGDQVGKRLASPEQGLSAPEVETRRQRYGANRLPEARARGPLWRFLAQFHNLLIYLLLVAAVITALLQHWVDAGVIIAVVVINAVIGFIQEGKAEQALNAIRNMLSPHAMVLRDGQRHSVPAEELVPGDRVLLQSGDKVPADLRLVQTRNLQIQEAILTGESMPVEKQTPSVSADAALGDRRGMAYSGTLVITGQASAIVVAIGADTEIGRISALLAGVETVTTPLLAQMAEFARWLTIGILGVAAATFAFGVWMRDYSSTEMFLAAVGLAVAAIPRRPAGDHDHHPGHRRTAHGVAQRHHPPPARGRDPGLGDRHLLGQDRHPDPQRDDRTDSRDRR